VLGAGPEHKRKKRAPPPYYRGFESHGSLPLAQATEEFPRDSTKEEAPLKEITQIESPGIK